VGGVVVDVDVVVTVLVAVRVLVSVLLDAAGEVWLDETPLPVWWSVSITPTPTPTIRTTRIAATILVDIPLFIGVYTS
jgi:hypothetical protein